MKNPVLKKVVLGAPAAQRKYFYKTIFQHLIHLCGISGFHRAFTRKYTLTLSRFMMFFVKLGFLVEIIGVLYSEICPKRAFFQMHFWNLKWLPILVLRHLPQCYIMDTWIFARNGVKK